MAALYARCNASQNSYVHGSRSEMRGMKHWCSQVLRPVKTSLRKGTVMNLFKSNRAIPTAAFATLTAMGVLLAQSSSKPAHAQQAQPPSARATAEDKSIRPFRVN